MALLHLGLVYSTISNWAAVSCMWNEKKTVRLVKFGQKYECLKHKEYTVLQQRSGLCHMTSFKTVSTMKAGIHSNHCEWIPALSFTEIQKTTKFLQHVFHCQMRHWDLFLAFCLYWIETVRERDRHTEGRERWGAFSKWPRNSLQQTTKWAKEG